MITKADPQNTKKLLAHTQSSQGFRFWNNIKLQINSIIRTVSGYMLDIRWQDIILSVGLVAIVTMVGLPFDHSFDHANIVMLYLLAEVIAATCFGLGPSIMAALVSVAAYHYFFILPRFTFDIEEAQYLLTFTGLLIVGLVISTLTARVREQAKTAQRREAQTAASYEFSRALATTIGIEAIIQAVIANIKRIFNRDVVILLPELEGNSLSSHSPNSDFILDEHGYTVAVWVFQNGRSAGRGTSILPEASLRYHPLKTARGTVGVLGVRPPDTAGRLTSEQLQLLEIFASQAAVAIERAQLDDQAQRTRLLSEKEKLQTALLNSISHDLRTPLASITGVLSSLRDDEAYLNKAIRHELVENACDEADRMNRLVANLLDMTRLQAGALRARRELCDLQDIIGVALMELSNKLIDRPVIVNIPPDLPLVPMDFVLMSRVFINILDNAHKYSAPGLSIEIRVLAKDSQIEIDIADRGLGIPLNELPHIFEKFYRVRRSDGASGTGLGLSICKGIIEVHRGCIRARNRPDGGTIITVSLPLEPAAGLVAEV